MAIFQQLRQHFPEQGQVIVIQKPQDLEKYGLQQQTWVEGHQLKTGKGRLFSEQPLCLILDLTTMTPGQIASLNDLLEEAPHSNGIPLGKKVRREVITSHDMLTGLKPSGSDCWRRLMRMPEGKLPQTGQEGTITTNAELLESRMLKQVPDGEPSVEIDFSAADDWYEHLFGGITLDEQGHLFFAKGKLSDLNKNNGNHYHLILKNAPWDNPEFTAALATALRNNEYEANNQWLPLPAQITLSREDRTPAQITALKEKYHQPLTRFRPNAPWLSLNSQQMETLKGGMRLEGAKVVRCNTLEQMVRGCGQLVISSPLSDLQWVWLLMVMEQIPQEHRPVLFTDLPETVKPGAHINIRRSYGTAEQDHPAHPPFFYEVTPHETWEDLLQQIRLVSREHFSFAIDNTPLMECLLQGTPVVLKGLENNGKIAQALETLFASPPCVFLHGKKVDLPKAHITLLLSESEQLTTSTPALLSQARKQTAKRKKRVRPHPFYKRLGEIPPSATKAYPSEPPWSATDFQRIIDQQAAHEQKLDNSPSIKPCHYRRALHVLTAKAYRGDPKAYGFIKAKITETWPDNPPPQQANQTALKEWLMDHPSPDLQQLKKDFWPLAQHCPASLHESIDTLDDPDDKALRQLALHVVGAASPKEQAPLAKAFKVSREEAIKKQYFNGNTRSTLKDALVASKNHLLPHVSISGEIEKLEGPIARVLSAKGSEPEKRRQLTILLSASFRTELPKSLNTLPQALLDGQRHDHSRHKRRLAHLTERARQHPVIFLQGEAGAGKSFMAQAIGSRLGPSAPPQCLVLSLGPNSNAGVLYGEQTLVTSTLPDGTTDSHTTFKEGPVLQWALSENPPVLVLDEANLAPEGLLAPLAGLARHPPTLHYQGKVYPLSDKHRVILTGNPDSYDGRHLDSTLSPLIPTFFYPPLPKEVMARAIIQPGLPGSWPENHKQQASEQILRLLEFYQKQLPGELLTPRDIKDVLAVVRQLYSYHPSTPTIKQIHACIRRGFSDSLAGALPSEEHQSINQKCMEAFPEDGSILAGPDQAFERFLEKLQTRYPNTNWRPEPIRQLVFSYWQSLEKDDTGRTAVIVEGPAGWGKDFILKQTLSLWLEEHEDEAPFLHINANPNRWDSLVESVKQAMRSGRKIAISELNLIPSRYLEGLFNDVLTGAAAPGFRLFATINPTSFGERETMSPAMKSRCTQIKLTALSPNDLESFISGQPGQHRELTQWLSRQFHQLTLTLARQKSPIQLSLDDLMPAAERLSREPDHEQWPEVFEQCLSIAFRSLKHQDCPHLKKIRKIPAAPPSLYFDIKQKIARILDGNVTKSIKSHFNTLQIFNSTEFKPVDYRLYLSRINCQDETVYRVPVEPATNAVKIITAKHLRSWPEEGLPLEIESGEVLGKVHLMLTHHWQPLPALSSGDQLKLIRPGTENGIEIGRCSDTGLLMVRNRRRVKQQPVTVDFIIEPNREQLSLLQFPGHIEKKSNLLDEKIRSALENEVFPPAVDNPSCRELQHIARLTSPVLQLHSLQAWAQSFTVDEDITGHDIGLLIGLIKSQKGVCRHRSWCFHVLCSYFNIPSRIVSNACHAYCEVSPDNGVSWYQAKLGGGPGTETMQHQEFPDVMVKPSQSSHAPPLKRPDTIDDSITAQKLLAKPHSQADFQRKQRAVEHSPENLPAVFEQPHDSFAACKKSLSEGRDIPESILKSTKDNLRTLIEENMSKPSSEWLLPSERLLHSGWQTLLQPGFFKYCQSDPEWTQQIKCLLTLQSDLLPLYSDLKNILLQIRTQVNNIRNNLSPDSDSEAYIGWLCDLCEHSKGLKIAFLGLLQPCVENPQFPHRNRVQALIESLLPSAPPTLSQSSIGNSNCFDSKLAKIAASIPLSEQLSEWRSQIAIATEYNKTPRENSRLIPARLASGTPPFLQQTTHSTVRPLIIDFNDLGAEAKHLITGYITSMTSKPIKNPDINEELIKLDGQKVEIPRFFSELFAHWLQQQMQGTSLYVIVDNYDAYCAFKPSPNSFIPDAVTGMILRHRVLHLHDELCAAPKSQIQSVFKQPSATVLQKKEILQLLSEFLGKIS